MRPLSHEEHARRLATAYKKTGVSTPAKLSGPAGTACIASGRRAERKWARHLSPPSSLDLDGVLVLPVLLVFFLRRLLLRVIFLQRFSAVGGESGLAVVVEIWKRRDRTSVYFYFFDRVMVLRY